MPNHYIDLHIGEKIKSRRHKLGMSQTDLGKKIGVTFQQIQKYEKGSNKIVASKLFNLAYQMEVPITYFFEGLKDKDFQEDISNEILSFEEETSEFIYKKEKSSRDAISLIRLYNNLPNKNIQKKLLSFLKALVSEDEEEEE